MVLFQPFWFLLYDVGRRGRGGPDLELLGDAVVGVQRQR